MAVRRPQPVPRRVARFVSFDKSHRKEQVCSSIRPRVRPPTASHRQFREGKNTCDHLAFPHSPGIFDWPVDKYLPIMLPELTFGDKVIVPAFYGKNCTTSMGLPAQFQIRPARAVTKDENSSTASASCKVTWSFSATSSAVSFASASSNRSNSTACATSSPSPPRTAATASAPPHARAGRAPHCSGQGRLPGKWKDLETVTADPVPRTAATSTTCKFLSVTTP